ncbi:proton channel OTOP3 [Elgaria multicarinata webbii]|uniref:proton channel OTOP3 n=1 Tax=Elgaria multicarinata webbii TaxID=159646 RepID=UPI002FCD10F2
MTYLTPALFAVSVAKIKQNSVEEVPVLTVLDDDDDFKETRGPSSPIHYETSWLHRHCSSLLSRDKQAQKAGQLFSGLLAMNVVLLGSAFIFSMIFNGVAITVNDVWIFLSVLHILSLSWIAYYLLFTRRKPHAIVFRDAHAGPMWVKGSLLLFGVFSIFLNIFRIGYTVSHLQCKSQVEFFFPSIQIIFICIQTYFIWCHAKDCTQVQHNLTRCGLMLTLASNFLLWLLAVTNDSVHMEIESERNHYVHELEGNGTTSCKCGNSMVCKVFRKGYVLLYPFNTEYCLISCAMLFVMWKNVGRRIHQHHTTCTKPEFKLHGVIFGPLLGISAIIIGICIFMMYQIQATGFSPSYQAFILYYSYYLFLLPVMTVGALVGTFIHGLEERELDTLKNPTRSLDVILLMGAALGQIGISYFSIVAIVATNPTDLLNSIILAYSVSLIIQHITQNIFIIEGLHRQALWAKEEKNEKEKCEESSPKVYNLEIRQDIQRLSHAYIQTYSHLNWKQKALKEISSFLIMCNIILWIMPSFGAHPASENGIGKSFYGYSTWFAVVNFGLPLGVFYRMHSVGGLLEVYRSA